MQQVLVLLLATLVILGSVAPLTTGRSVPDAGEAVVVGDVRHGGLGAEPDWEKCVHIHDVGEAEGDESDEVFRDAPLAESVFWFG